MKKIIVILLLAAAFTGCKKDTSTKVIIGSSDIATINGLLKGTWLFPTNDQTVIDANGKTLANNGYVSAPAMQFDGGSGVTVYDNLQTKAQDTYVLSTKNGFIYLDVTDAKGNDVTYQVLEVTSQTLKLISTAPYVYYNGTSPEPAQSVSNIVLQKQNSADVTGNLVKVIVTSTTPFDINVYVTHTKLKAPADTAILLDTRQKVQGTYTFAFPASSNDQLNVDVVGDYTQTAFYAYYNGLPMSGSLSYGGQEFKTTSGWLVP